MPVPDEGNHAGHLVQRGMCADCGRGVTQEDILTVACPKCKAVPGKPCARTGKAAERRNSHAERMFRAHGHSLDAIPELIRNIRPSSIRTIKPAKRSSSKKNDVDPLIVACPQCRAPIGEKCRGARTERNGEAWLRETPHASRSYISSHRKPQ